MPIHLLADEVASQIAAGEVIERPASVVKELFENALDSGASQIWLRCEGAGKQVIEVVDNGCGIPAEELRLAVSRHATSKLSSAEDLFRIRTLGFRGEALASIGSIAHLTVISRPSFQALGGELRVHGGVVEGVKSVGAPAGTTVRVEDLFYNVPARLKFLKTDTTERLQIVALASRYALAYPNARVSLTQEGRTTLQTTGSGNRREILSALWGGDAARQMLEVDAREEGIRISGYISPLGLNRSNRREMVFFINGRWVQSTPLSSALLQAYATMLMVGRYPMAALFLELDPESVDVNVHPAKAEVRFRSQDRIFSAVQRAARRALLAYSPAPDLTAPRTWFAPPERAGLDISWQMAGEAEQPGDPDDMPQGMSGPEQLLAGRVPLLRPIGQISLAYIVAEGPDGLYLIDQHAAHERVLFERFMQRGFAAEPGQALLQPAVVELPPGEAGLLSEQLPLLARFGFQVEPFGPGAFQVRAVPAIIQTVDPAGALRSLVEDFEEDETPLQAEQEARLVARVCKRAAVKAGKVLSSEEQRALVEALEACQSPRTCPHGRPTMIHLSIDVLERQFGRKGAR